MNKSLASRVFETSVHLVRLAMGRQELCESRVSSTDARDMNQEPSRPETRHPFSVWEAPIAEKGKLQAWLSPGGVGTLLHSLCSSEKATPSGQQWSGVFLISSEPCARTVDVMNCSKVLGGSQQGQPRGITSKTALPPVFIWEILIKVFKQRLS